MRIFSTQCQYSGVQWGTVGKAYARKTDRKLKITGGEIAWVDVKSNKYPYFAYQNDQRKKTYTLGDFENNTPTHMDATHAISKSE